MPNPKKPTKLKIIQGTTNVTRDRKTNIEFSALVTMPDCPDELKNISYAESIWNDSTQELFNLRMLHTSDLQLLMAYCMEMARYWICQDAINKYGMSQEVKDNKGNVIKIIPLPQVRMSASHLTIARTIAGTFGFTPSSRAGISLPGKSGADDPMEELLNKYK